MWPDWPGNMTLPNFKVSKVFIVSFAATFLMVLIPHIKNASIQLVNPYVKPQVMDIIKPKLERWGSEIKLKKDTQIIPQVLASADYDQALAYAVVDFDSGAVLVEKNFSKELPIASLAKLMTAIVSLDLANKEDIFEVSDYSASQIPTKVMLKTGERYSLEELLYSLLISSANDSAQVIQEGINKKYGNDIFIKAMNEKAKILDLKNSHFTNPQGFDDAENFSTVEDLSVLSHLALTKYPLIAQIVGMQINDRTGGGKDMRFYLQNWNGLLGLYPGVNGVKIGNTGKAKYTTIVSSTRDNKTILAVLLGAPTVLARDLWTSKLLDLGFEKKGVDAVNLTEEQLQEKYSKWIYFR